MGAGVLDGKTAIVTGCGRIKGIGRACALALSAAGANVAVTDLRSEGARNSNGNTGDVDVGAAEAAVGWKGLESLKAEIEGLGGRALALIGDVGAKADAERMVAEAVAHFGAVDILVNNAAAPQAADRNWTWEVPEEAFDIVLRTNTKGVFLMSTAVTRHLLARKAWGRIINIASGAGKRGFARTATYCASKFAVIGLTQAMSQELGPHNITVNAVCPGPIATARSAGAAVTPVPRPGVASDIANAVAFLASPASDYINGQSLNVDGGFLPS